MVGNSIATLVIGESEKSLDRDQYNKYLDSYGKRSATAKEATKAE